MACEHCSSKESRCAIVLLLGPHIPAHYCPACGESLVVSEFLDSMKKRVDDELTALFVEMDKRDETVEIDGVKLIVEHVPPMPKTVKAAFTPINYSVDLDKIDIGREMGMLEEKMGGNPITKHKEYIHERVKQMMNEKGK